MVGESKLIGFCASLGWTVVLFGCASSSGEPLTREPKPEAGLDAVFPNSEASTEADASHDASTVIRCPLLYPNVDERGCILDGEMQGWSELYYCDGDGSITRREFAPTGGGCNGSGGNRYCTGQTWSETCDNDPEGEIQYRCENGSRIETLNTCADP